MKDLHSHLLGALLLAPAILNADTSSDVIDLVDHQGCELFISVGVGGITFDATNKLEFVLTASDESGGTFTAVADNDVLGATVGSGGEVLSLVSAHAAAKIYRVGYIGDKRFLKLTAEFSGTHGTGTGVSAVAVQGHGRRLPEADQA